MSRLSLALLGLLALAGGLRADTDPARLTPDEAFGEAEKAYQRDELLAAEKLYLRARQTNQVANWRKCSDRLLLVYLRLGRADKLIDLGLSYEKWLRDNKDEQRLHELALQLGEGYLLLGHYTPARTRLEQATKPATTKLAPLERVHAWALRGRLGEITRDKDEATRGWDEVIALGNDLLERLPDDFPPRDRTHVVWMIADAYRYKQAPTKAIARLEALLKTLERNEWPAQRDTLFRLARQQMANADPKAAEKTLREALVVHRKVEVEDKLIQADILQALGDALEKQKRHEDADKVRKEAVACYLDVVKESGADSARTVLAFWRLQTLYEKDNQYRQAVQLAISQGEAWTPATPLHPRLIAEEGGLQTILGAYRKGHEPLQKAVEQLEKQTPLNLIELPRALNNLALVELTRNKIDEAEKHGKRVEQLYRDNRLPADPTLVESLNVLGITAALRGDGAVALDYFQRAIRLCAPIMDITKPQRSHLQLNIALLRKSQGELMGALDACETAYTLFKEFSHPDALGNAWFDAALASMKAALAAYRSAAAHAPNILRLCKRYDIKEGLLPTIAKHTLALDLLASKKYADAEALWVEVQALQEKQKDDLFLPRTLNYRGLAAEMQKKHEEAGKFYAEAVKLQENNARALPGIHFISHWRLANILDSQGDKDGGRKRLMAAVEIAEKGRARVSGAYQQRATFYAQFAPAFDELVERCVRDGKPEEALAYAVRARSRSLLDQLLVSGVDPRRELTGDEGKKLLAREEAALQEISRIRAQAFLQPSEALDEAATEKKRKELQDRLEKAEAAYAEVWRDMLQAHPLYRRLETDALAANSLATIRAKALNDKTHLLLYWVGRLHSYAFLIGPKTVEVFPLTAPAKLVDEMRTLGKDKLLVCEVTGREFPATDDLPAKPDASVPLGRGLAWVLVEVYRANLDNSQLGATRSLRITRSSASNATTTSTEQVGLVFVPAALRKRMATLAPEQLIVIPDGALHRLPLEALVTKDGDKPRYLLDDWPALVYAPSAPVLALLLDRPAPKASTSSLLTIGNVAFPKDKTSLGGLEAPQGLLALLSKPLVHSARETAEIAKLFPAEQAQALTGTEAAEANITSAVKGKRYVHLTTHGYAEARNGNLFGGLVLSPPAQVVGTGNDGMLCLHEIHRLDLSACDLAVLSACWTNHGPQSSQEAGVTLAGGFLSAGARRVVGTHWAVADRSSAELVIELFREIRAAEKKGEVLPHAVALHRARKKIRDRDEWSAPFHWAPFVLVGRPG